MKPQPHAAEQQRQIGLAASARGAWLHAQRAFEQATRLAPCDPLMWLNLARAHHRNGNLEAAVTACERAAALAPSDPVACLMLGEYLQQSRRATAALAVFERFPAQAPRDADWHNAHGNALFLAGQPRRAVDAFMAALALRMDAALVHYRLGLALMDLGLAQESTECFRTAIALGDPYVRTLALSLLVFEGRRACDWTRIDADTQALLAAVDSPDASASEHLSPFALISLDTTPAQQRRLAERHTAMLTRGVTPLPPAPPRAPGRIRLGYLSSDFTHHATAELIAELLELRDTSRFEVWIYSHSASDASATAARVRAACDHFVDCTEWSSDAIAKHMRAAGLDIAVDLKGHTRDNRIDVLARRPAPVQVAFLGYPGTSGAPFIDYVIGDAIVTPLEHGENYTECIAQLPHSYQPNDRHRALPAAPPRAALGLPEGAVVLCCFNQSYKLSPAMLDAWAAILAGAPQTVLWLLDWNPHATLRLTTELATRGVSQDRVFWAPKLSLDDHLARLQAADLFLDTWPCNAHTTASEALWAGVPVLTCPGATFASRVGASLVAACDLPAELACASTDDYVHTATLLAHHPQYLATMQQHLRQHRTTLPLFDTPRFARDYEALLEHLTQRQQRGEAPRPLPASAIAHRADLASNTPTSAHTEP